MTDNITTRATDFEDNQRETLKRVLRAFWDPILDKLEHYLDLTGEEQERALTMVGDWST